MLYKTINRPTNPSSDIGGRPKGSPITYAKTCGIVKDFPYAVCTFDDGSFNFNEFLDGALLQCTSLRPMLGAQVPTPSSGWRQDRLPTIS